MAGVTKDSIGSSFGYSSLNIKLSFSGYSFRETKRAISPREMARYQTLTPRAD
jgi:hypothetical protein